MEAILDIDMFKYAVAGVGEDRSVLVTHKETGWSKEFKTRTEFYGHHKKKQGGWLSEINKGREPEKIALPEHFTYEDIQRPQPIENVLHSAKLMVEKALEASGATSYKAFIGKGDSFRVERSTLLKYKGNRENMLIPIHIQEVTEYLKHKYKAEVVTELEADDACVMAAYKQPKRFVLGEDKDYFGCAVKYFNVNHPEKGVINCDKFGSLYRDSKGKVRGEGRLFFYWQVASQDDTDNYKAHCFSDISWGEVTAYEWLKDSQNDKEALEKVYSAFRHLYPEPKVVTGWRGSQIEIDAEYVMNEMWDMARMRRWESDTITATEVLLKMSIL